MKLRFIEYQTIIYIVVGVGYDHLIEPPDVFYCIRLEGSIIRSILTSKYEIKIPITEAIEITDINRIKVIRLLYGDS